MNVPTTTANVPTGFFADELKPLASRLPTYKGLTMKYSILISTMLAAVTLAACEKPTVVNVPAPTPAPVVVPVPVPVAVPGPTGAPGAPGADGAKGEPGKPGDSTTVIVTPPPAPVPRR